MKKTWNKIIIKHNRFRDVIQDHISLWMMLNVWMQPTYYFFVLLPYKSKSDQTELYAVN